MAGTAPYQVKVGITIAIALAVVGGGFAAPPAKAEAGDGLRMRVDGPDGSFVEVVLLSAVAAYKPTVTTTGSEVKLCVDLLKIYYGPHKAENIPYVLDSLGDDPCTPGWCDGDHDGYDNGEAALEVCLDFDHTMPVTREPVTNLQAGPVGVWLEGEGCIKVYHPLAGEPIIIGSETVFVTGPLTMGGSC